ncbi:transglutaminase domain-containing protein [Ferviditalea candida]|uniref:Transglutaminase domain-containing protein n=1 Tax=Ferviditalea candida TaxID=3108399 RepID=A0ABU5ZEJ3_9BACL|nr:transglutaminase domain-containing protein [Paenibacillaceae bacterium T2]
MIYLLWHILASYLGTRFARLNRAERYPAKFPFLNGLAGGAIGSVLGTTRALILIAVLFAYVTLTPDGPLTNYIKESKVYQQGATQIIEPFTGEFIHERLPIFTQAVQDQISEILQRRYEIIDRNIPDNISEAAKTIVAGKRTDLEKARALYDWVGSRVKYDNAKVTLYEEKQIWKEQTPEDTYRSKKGVCIDYSRLYAVMARSVGLRVKVVTGQGYDGRSSYGPHAWNEVYITEQGKWIPLDTTWAGSGANWFDPPHFYDTHIKGS